MSKAVMLSIRPMNAFGSFLYGTDNHGSPILGDIVLLREGINSDGELDLLGLTELDIKHLCSMAVTLSEGEIKLKREAE